MMPYAFNADPDLKNLERSAALRHIRKLEVVMWVDDGTAEGLVPRAERVCAVLSHAKGLKGEITVCWLSRYRTRAPNEQRLWDVFARHFETVKLTRTLRGRHWEYHDWTPRLNWWDRDGIDSGPDAVPPVGAERRS